MPLPPLLTSIAIIVLVVAVICFFTVYSMVQEYERRLRKQRADHDLHIALVTQSFDKLDNAVNRVFYSGKNDQADVEEFLMRGLPSALTNLNVNIKTKPPGLKIGDVTV